MYQIVSSMLVTITEVLYLTLLDYHNDEFQDIACQITAFLLEYTAWMKATSTTCLIQTESIGYTTNSSGWSPPPENFIDNE